MYDMRFHRTDRALLYVDITPDITWGRYSSVIIQDFIDFRELNLDQM